MSSEIYFNNQKVLSAITSYNELSNASKPTIESVILEGNRTARELNLMSRNEITQLIAQSRIPAVLPNYPATPVTGVVYYIGTSAPYNVCLYAVNDVGALERVDLGTTNIDISSKQDKIDNSLLTTSKNIVGAINENKTNIDLKQNKIDDSLITTNKNIVSAINEIETDINAIPNTYAPIQGTSGNSNTTFQVDDCVFNITSSAIRNWHQQYFADVQMIDPISNGTLYGGMVTQQYYGGSYVMIYQTYTAVYSTAISGGKMLTQRIIFKRSGYYNQASGNISKDVYDNRASITWKPWYPVEYPSTDISNKINTTNYNSGNNLISFVVSGENMIFDINGIVPKASATGAIPKILFDTNSLYDIPIKKTVRATLKGLSNATNCALLTTGAGTLLAIFAMWDVIQDETYYGQIVIPLGY